MESQTGKIVVGIVSHADPRKDCCAWSGTLFKLREALEQAGYNVRWIRVEPNKYAVMAAKAVLRYVAGKHWKRSKLYCWLCAKSIKRDELAKCDYLMFPGGAQMLRYLKEDVSDLPPTLYYADGCFHQMVDYYWYGIPRWVRRQAEVLEKSAIEESSVVMYSSDWAKECAINWYGCPEEKVEVLEFGANLEEKDIVESEVYREGELRVLFSGVDWQRKGGDIAVETVRKLNEDGIEARLYLVGIEEGSIPKEYRNLEYVEYVGFLKKENVSDYERYVEIVRNCHCMLLSSRAECSSIALCEAAAFGLPSFTYDTGGLCNYVINGQSGYRLECHSTAEDFAKAIEGVIERKEFEKLHRGALEWYQEKISWGAWRRRFPEIMEKRFGGNYVQRKRKR